MSAYMFGVSRRKISRNEVRIMESVAKRHGVTLVEATVPGTGYQRWFEVRNYGEPFNTETARAVIEEITQRGVEVE